MTRDAELIYNALLRAERRMEQGVINETHADAVTLRKVQLGVIITIREEIGRGLAEARRPPAIVKAKIGEVG